MHANRASAHAALESPEVGDARHYRRRITWLAVVHAALFIASVAGIALVVSHGEVLVTLAQRSNVETLTLAFFLVFFGYFAVLMVPGAIGAARIAWIRAANKHDTPPRRHRRPARAAFDRAIELASAPGQPWEVGGVRFDGVRVTHAGGSNTLLGFVEARLRALTGADFAIVQWGSTDDEELRAFAATAEALRAQWPKIAVTDEVRDTLARELADLAPALREEACLPDWEYAGEHKLPIIPEPLGIISLSRSQRRVDPLASLSATLAVVLVVLALLCIFIARPPWIPGR